MRGSLWTVLFSRLETIRPIVFAAISQSLLIINSLFSIYFSLQPTSSLSLQLHIHYYQHFHYQ